MTFLLHSGDALLGADATLIKASDVGAFLDAHALLAEAQRVHADAVASAARIETEAHARGLAAAQGEVRETLDAALAWQAKSIESELARQRDDIAALALAGAETIIGALDPDDLAPRLAARAIAQIAPEQRLTIRVAPERVEATRARIGSNEAVTVEGDAVLGTADCVLATANGRVIADLDVQLAALAARWGAGQRPDAAQ